MTAGAEALFIAQTAHNEALRPHRAGDDPHLALLRRHRPFARHQHLFTKMTLFLHIVVMAIHRLLLGQERLWYDARQRGQHPRHHRLAIMAGKILRPLHGFDVVVIVPAPLLEIGQVPVRQVGDVLLHILLRQGDKHVADRVAHATRAAVQHDPHPLLLVQTDLDKVIPGAQCPQVLMVIGFQQLRILIRQPFEARRQLSPVVIHFIRRLFPRPFVATGAGVGAPVWHGLFNGAAQSVEVIRQIACQQ